MWDILVTMVLLSLVIVLIIAPIIAILLLLITKTAFKDAWILSSLILVGLLIFIGGSALLITHFEEKSHLKKADEQFEEMTDELSEENSTKKVKMDIYTTGNFGKPVGRYRRGSATVSYVIKNYNDADFKGKAIIYVLYNGEKIDETEVEIELAAKEDNSDFVYGSELNINKKMWYDIEFEYSIHGDFQE